jgi:PP-loop superfamily ATP-utilizing enzyme
MNTIGIVEVAALAASVAGKKAEAMTATLPSTSSLDREVRFGRCRLGVAHQLRTAQRGPGC